MKKTIILLVISSIFLCSCDPDVANEGITLPQIDFPFVIDKDTSHIKLGDTLRISCTISSILSDGTKLRDGKAAIKIGSGYSPEIPIMDNYTQKTAKEGIDFSIINEDGLMEIQEQSSNLLQISVYPNGGDSIKVAFLYIPLKTGTHSFDLASLFFEGTQGKTRTNPYFNITDNNINLFWQVPNMPATSPNDPAYNKQYYFAVTD